MATVDIHFFSSFKSIQFTCVVSMQPTFIHLLTSEKKVSVLHTVPQLFLITCPSRLVVSFSNKTMNFDTCISSTLTWLQRLALVYFEMRGAVPLFWEVGGKFRKCLLTTNPATFYYCSWCLAFFLLWLRLTKKCTYLYLYTIHLLGYPDKGNKLRNVYWS